MSEPSDRIAAAERAAHVLETEVRPRLHAVVQVYRDEMERLIASEPMTPVNNVKLVNLGMAIRIASEFEAQFVLSIVDGKTARSELEHARRVAELSPEARRYL